MKKLMIILFGTSIMMSLNAQVQTQSLTKAEVQSLIHMREEEKLARDVYTKLYEKWGLTTFERIARSEQRHMDMVKSLLLKYGIQDPVKSDAIGDFSDPEMKKLYNELVSKGEKSLLSALMVGATIEDLDIYDLEKAIKETKHNDIKDVYGMLMRGSENHMRAFNNQIKQNGGYYKAQYISQKRLDEILSKTNGRGRGMGKGLGRGMRGQSSW